MTSRCVNVETDNQYDRAIIQSGCLELVIVSPAYDLLYSWPEKDGMFLEDHIQYIVISRRISSLTN